jgi:hypothetical protein
MIDLKKIASLRRRQPASLLGLSLDGSRLEGVWLRRANGGVQTAASFAVDLSLDPLTAAPELAGREIRNHLEAAEIRERRCVVALPLQWALVTHAAVPPLPEADAASFLRIEAERNLPCDIGALVTATSWCREASGGQYAMFAGIPRNHIAALEAALRGAGLKPEGFSPGITALQPPGEDGVLALTAGAGHTGLQVTGAGGVAALRALEGTIENEGGRRALDAGRIAREVRVTLGQLPEELRKTVRRVRVFGPADFARELIEELETRLKTPGLKIEAANGPDAGEAGLQPPENAPASAAFSLAAAHLAGRRPPLEFLPPRISQWEQLVRRRATGRVRKAGAAAGAVAMLVLGAFGFQQVQLWRLDARWSEIKDRVGGLEAMQTKIKTYRPWFDESQRCLSILRQLTAAFPEDGVVTARTVEIREANLVTCTGTARDHAALLRALEKLREADNVADLKVDRIRGGTPMQFTFDFRWVEGGANAN